MCWRNLDRIGVRKDLGSLFQNQQIPVPVTAAHSKEQSFAARSHHPGGMMAAMCDGSIHFFSDNIDIAAWRAAATARGGEVPKLASL